MLFDYRYWLRAFLEWLLDDKDDEACDKMVTKELIGQDIEVEEEDEGYSSVNRHQSRSSRRARWGGGTIETDLEEGQTIEEVKQRFSLLKEAYEEMRDQMTRIEFEADLLKDEKIEREEEMRLQKSELMKLVEVCSVLHESRSADQQRIASLQQQLAELRTREDGE